MKLILFMVIGAMAMFPVFLSHPDRGAPPRSPVSSHLIQLSLHNGQRALKRAPLINTDAIDDDRKACYYASRECRPIPIYGVPPIYFGFVFLIFGMASVSLSLCGFAIQLGKNNKWPYWLFPASILFGVLGIYLLSHASTLILIGRYSLPQSPSAAPDYPAECRPPFDKLEAAIAYAEAGTK